MDFSPGGATKVPQTVIDLGAVSGMDNFGFYDSGTYDAASTGSRPYPATGTFSLDLPVHYVGFVDVSHVLGRTRP